MFAFHKQIESLVFFTVDAAGCLRNVLPKPANVDLTLSSGTTTNTDIHLAMKTMN